MTSNSRYLVLGNPIEHSKSPQIHALFAEQTGEPIEYDKQLVALDDFANTVSSLLQQGIAGANVTVPFKEEAAQLADTRSDRVSLAGAANTLIFNQGRIHADNTDGLGMVRDIVENNGYGISGKRVLILGAGGAVRGVLLPLLEQGPAEVVITNRTVARAEEIVSQLSEYPVQACGFDALSGMTFDLVINGTSLGLQGKVAAVPGQVLAAQAAAYDMMYGAGSEPFQAWAREQGAVKIMDGLGMLVEQAAESFQLWRGVRPETASVIATLRASV